MGCRASSTVTEDPDVPLYTVVRTLVTTVTKKKGTEVKVSAPTVDMHHGLLYVKDSELRYDAAFGTKLMPKSDTRSWKLQDIQQITAVTSDRFTVRRVKQPSIVVSLNPGLDIKLEDANGSGARLQMAMPYVEVSSADSFKTQLEQHVLAAKQAVI